MKKLLFLIPTILLLSACNPSENPGGLDEVTPETGSLVYTGQGLSNVGSGYPDPETVDVDGQQIYFESVQKSGSKGNIQMRNASKGSGVIENRTPLKGRLIVDEYINIIQPAGTDTTVCLSVYAAKKIGPVGCEKTSLTNYTLLSSPTGRDQDGHRIFDFGDVSEYRYFKLINESSNAQYLYSVSWTW